MLLTAIFKTFNCICRILIIWRISTFRRIMIFYKYRGIWRISKYIAIFEKYWIVTYIYLLTNNDFLKILRFFVLRNIVFWRILTYFDEYRIVTQKLNNTILYDLVPTHRWLKTAVKMLYRGMLAVKKESEIFFKCSSPRPYVWWRHLTHEMSSGSIINFWLYLSFLSKRWLRGQ